jgi:hypothetical protein
MNITLLLSKIGLSSNLSQDVVLILFIALVSFIFGMVLGKHKLMSVLVNVYVSFAVIAVVPKEIFTQADQKVLAFIVLLAILTVISRKIFDISFASGGSAFMWRVFVVSFLQVALILSIVLSLIPKKEALTYVSNNAYNYLVVGWAPLFWMLIPLVCMFLLYRKSKY